MNVSVLYTCAALVGSAFLTMLVRRYAIKTHWLDHPNDRSSHTAPTPRGGGLGIAIASLGAAVALWFSGQIDDRLLVAVLGGGFLVATIGMLDDRRAVSVRVRMLAHFAAAGWAIGWLGGLPPIQFAERSIDLGIAGDLAAVIGIVWTLNLFNFMDGIDGIAGSEAAFITLAATVLTATAGLSPGVSSIALAVGAACIGFLIWNWPPAKIFMGDVGSGFLGYAIAVLAIAGARDTATSVIVWLILGAVFFVDATVTLVRRVIQREPVHEAHRTHAYQWLARRWQSHRRVTVAVMLINVFWLFPCAYLVSLFPQQAWVILLIALAPLSVLALLLGAGRSENPRTGELR